MVIKPILYPFLNDLQTLHEIVSFISQLRRADISMKPRVGSAFQTELISVFTKNNLLYKLPEIDGLSLEVLVRETTPREAFIAFRQKSEQETWVPAKKLSTSLDFSVSVLFTFNKVWELHNEANTVHYDIPPLFSRRDTNRTIKGFSLSNVIIGRNREGKPVAAKVKLGSDFSVFFYNLDAFEAWQWFLRSDHHYGKLVSLKTVPIMHDPQSSGTLYAPCVDCKEETSGHLQDMYFLEDGYPIACVKEATVSARFSLSEKGIYARAESSTVVASLGGHGKSEIDPNTLCIDLGLVAHINYKNQPIFMAYVPQTEFLQ